MTWVVAAALWAAGATFGLVAWHHTRTTPDAPFSVRERAVAFRFWFRRWWVEECGPGLYWFTIVAGYLAVVLALSLVMGG